MWRALFLAVGVSLVILGVQCLGVQKFVLKGDAPPTNDIFADAKAAVTPRREIVPQPWVPYSLMSTGTVVCLYCFSIPSRVKG